MSGGLAVVGILVTNAGPSTARGVTVLDSYNGDADVGPSPNGPRRRASCNRTAARVHACPTIAPGGSKLVQFVIVPFDAPGHVRQHRRWPATTTPGVQHRRQQRRPAADGDRSGARTPVHQDRPADILAGGVRVHADRAQQRAVDRTQAIPSSTPSPRSGPRRRVSPSGTCSIVAQTVTCTAAVVVPAAVFGGPPDAQDVTITVTGTVDPGIAGASVTNSATARRPGRSTRRTTRRRATTPITRRPTSASSRRARRPGSSPAARWSTTWPSRTPARPHATTRCSPTCCRLASPSTRRCRTRAASAASGANGHVHHRHPGPGTTIVLRSAGTSIRRSPTLPRQHGPVRVGRQ